MRSVIKYGAIALVAGGLMTGLLINNASATQSPKQEATEAVNHYLDSMKSGNVNEMMKYTEDTRFKSEATKRTIYEGLVKNDPIQNPEILNLSVVDSTHVNVTLRGTTNANGTQVVTLPVVKKNDQWKLLITGVKTTRNK